MARKAQLPSHIVRIAGFDPAITNMGWCIVDYDLTTDKYNIIATGELNGPKMIRQNKEMRDKFDKPFCVLTAYKKYITENIFKKYKNVYTVSESAFHFKFASVLASLTLVIHTIRQCSHDVFFKDIYTVAPMETKKEVANDHMAKKDKIRDCILKNEQLVWADDIKKEELSEHEYDAIGHVICFVKRKLIALINITVE